MSERDVWLSVGECKANKYIHDAGIAVSTGGVMGVGISKLGQLAITVSNVEHALGFYRDCLGLPFLFSPTDNLAFLQCGDTRIMLSTPQGTGEAGKNSIPYFLVADVEDAYDRAVGHGATAERPPQLAAQMPDHALWMAFVKDPDGNVVGLMEERQD